MASIGSKIRGALAVSTMLAVSLPLTGCIAAAPALMAAYSAATVASAAYLSVKVYQTATGGQLEVNFEDDLLDPAAPMIIQGAASLAFWPAPGRAMVSAAEHAETSLEIARILPPSQTGEIVRAQSLPEAMEQLTSSERLEAFRTLARSGAIDLVFAIEQGDAAYSSAFGLRRQTATTPYRAFLYHRGSDRLIWSGTVNLIVPVSGAPASPTEIQTLAGQAIAEHLGDIASGEARGAQPEERRSIRGRFFGG